MPPKEPARLAVGLEVEGPPPERSRIRPARRIGHRAGSPAPRVRRGFGTAEKAYARLFDGGQRLAGVTPCNGPNRSVLPPSPRSLLICSSVGGLPQMHRRRTPVAFQRQPWQTGESVRIIRSFETRQRYPMRHARVLLVLLVRHGRPGNAAGAEQGVGGHRAHPRTSSSTDSPHPPSLADDVRRYTESRPANFADWHPTAARC